MAVSTVDLEILSFKQRRLGELLKQQAKLGFDTPATITSEIAEIKGEIAEASPGERHALLYDLVMELRTDVRRLYYLMPICMLLLCGLLILLVKL